jgi:hypothetical protein
MRKRLENPIARETDPASSIAAGERVTRSGQRHKNAAEVLDLVRRLPGSTSVELFASQAHADDRLDRHEVSRRLADLERSGHVRKGPQRRCRVNRTAMVTWYIVQPTLFPEAERPAAGG